MPRAMWSGSVSFGLVSIPVKLYSATSPRRISFRQIDRKSGARVRNKRVSEKTGREVDYDDIVKGYEVGKDTYVTVERGELEELQPEATHRVDIEDFVHLDQVDPIFYDTTYYLAPDKGGEKAYMVLLKAMEETEKAAIGRVVIRTKEHLAAIRPIGSALAMHTMLFHDEIVPAADIGDIPDRKQRVGDRELKMARQLIDSLTTDFEAERYEDTYRQQLEELLEAKAEGKTITVEEPEEPAKVVDLVEALRASVEETKDGGKRTRRSA